MVVPLQSSPVPLRAVRRTGRRCHHRRRRPPAPPQRDEGPHARVDPRLAADAQIRDPELYHQVRIQVTGCLRALNPTANFSPACRRFVQP